MVFCPQGTILEDPLVFEDAIDFQSRLETFLITIYKYQSGVLLYEEDLVNLLIKTSILFISGNWDSFRVVSVILGKLSFEESGRLYSA
jgi:hypothetical protein